MPRARCLSDIGAEGSATYRILEALLEGLREDGAETQLTQVTGPRLEPRHRCYTCWMVTPGRRPIRGAIRARSGPGRSPCGWPEVSHLAALAQSFRPMADHQG